MRSQEKSKLTSARRSFSANTLEAAVTLEDEAVGPVETGIRDEVDEVVCRVDKGIFFCESSFRNCSHRFAIASRFAFFSSSREVCFMESTEGVRIVDRGTGGDIGRRVIGRVDWGGCVDDSNPDVG